MKLGRGEKNISVSGVDRRPVDAVWDNGWGSESDWKSTASRLPNSSSVFLVITKELSETVDNHSVLTGRLAGSAVPCAVCVCPSLPSLSAWEAEYSEVPTQQ